VTIIGSTINGRAITIKRAKHKINHESKAKE
jgi:hypothetical protein